jgi:hypothetical protein
MGGSSSSAEINELKTKVQALERLKTEVIDLGGKLKDSSTTLAAGIDYKKVAESITGSDKYNTDLASAISKNNKLAEIVSTGLAKNPTALETIVTSLQANPKFANSLSKELTSNEFVESIRGLRGETGSIAASKDSVRDQLYNTKYTMWCADGGLCKLPFGSTGIEWINAEGKSMGGTKIYEGDGQFNIESDDNIYFKTGSKLRATVANDGFTVENSVRIKGDLNLDGRINLAGWKIEGGSENSLVFRRGDAGSGDNQPYLRMAQDGNFWVSRSVANGWVADSIKDLRDNKAGNDHDHKYWEPSSGGKHGYTGNAVDSW